jgi:hemin uptake protein HemP
MLQTHPEPELVTVDEAPENPTDRLPAPPRPEWNSDELLGAGDEALIVHRNDVYRLRRTLTGKLILTK